VAIDRRDIVALGAAARAAQADQNVLCSPPDFPAAIPLGNSSYKDWSLALQVSNLWTAIPHGAQDVVVLANWARAHGYKLRAIGHSHNLSPFLVPNGTDPCAKVLLVDTRQLKGPPRFQLRNGQPTATFGTGTTVEEATLYLESLDNQGTGAAPGYTFQNMTAPGQLTLGGVLAIGAHGTGVPWKIQEPNLNGCMSNLIVSFKAVVTDPTAADPNEYGLKEFNREDADASAFLVHLGRAFLTEVTLRVIPNYYLQVANWYPSADVLFQEPGALLSPQVLASLLDDYGRIEVIWFPFTSNPWVKTWELKDHQLQPQVPGPYNYPWANTISSFENELIKMALFADPAVTPALSWGLLAAARLEASEGNRMNGTARDLLLYVQDSTVRATACGYAVQIRRDQVQEVMHAFYVQYSAMLSRYQEMGRYPVNGPVTLRFTTVDLVQDLGVPDAVAPALSASHSIDPADRAMDTVAWIDIVTIPGTKYSDAFFAEFEDWMKSQWGEADSDRMRPEWSKGWAYTEARGAWSNRDILTRDIPAHYNQSSGTKTFDWARTTLAKYDTSNLYTNAFLDMLLPGS